MSILEYSSIVYEINMLSSYLEFGHNNLADFRQRLTSELNESIKKFRVSEDIHSDVSNDEIIRQVEVRVDAMTVLDEFPIDESGGNSFVHISSIREGLELANQYDNTLYATIVIMVYSCIERGLIRICDLQEAKNCQGVIPQTRDYLDNKLGYRIDNKVWRELKFIRWLRNTIIHSGMSFSLDDSLGDIVYDSLGYDAIVKAQPELIEYLKSNNIYIKEVGVISLNLEYCKYVIEFARQFFGQIDSCFWKTETSRHN